MKKRLTYEAPEAEVMRVRFEKNFLETEPTGLGGMTTGDAGTSGYNGDFDSSQNHHTL